MLVEYEPKRVIQILSGSRSGSSLLKKVLARSPSVTSLDGEEEPYFRMSGNGYGLTSTSDAFNSIVNPGLFRDLISRELTTVSYSDRMRWRLKMQFLPGGILERLLNDCPKAHIIDWLRMQGVYGHYDQCKPEERIAFNRSMAYEMPPFIIPSFYKEINDTLLLKCPYNSYRLGLIESIYPDAEFSYVVLTRNPAATINGLIDAWQCSYGFHKHLTPCGWWKFDLPPGWEEYIGQTLVNRCWFQWWSTYTRLLGHPGHWIGFEELLANPAETIQHLCSMLFIDPPPDLSLPLVMSTKEPVPFRWRERAAVIEPILETKKSKLLIDDLNYKDRTRWV